MILESILYGWNKKKGWVASSSYEHNSSLSTCMKPTFRHLHWSLVKQGIVYYIDADRLCVDWDYVLSTASCQVERVLCELH